MLAAVKYLHFRLKQFYQKGKEEDPAHVASGIMAMLFAAHLLTIYYYLDLKNYLHWKPGLWSMLGIILGLHILIHYSMTKADNVADGNWSNEALGVRRRNGVLIIIYCLSSIVVLAHSFYYSFINHH